MITNAPQERSKRVALSAALLGEESDPQLIRRLGHPPAVSTPEKPRPPREPLPHRRNELGEPKPQAGEHGAPRDRIEATFRALGSPPSPLQPKLG
eukprot:982511-Prymnesium_polylepis.1